MNGYAGCIWPRLIRATTACTKGTQKESWRQFSRHSAGKAKREEQALPAEVGLASVSSRPPFRACFTPPSMPVNQRHTPPCMADCTPDCRAVLQPSHIWVSSEQRTASMTMNGHYVCARWQHSSLTSFVLPTISMSTSGTRCIMSPCIVQVQLSGEAEGEAGCFAGRAAGAERPLRISRGQVSKSPEPILQVKRAAPTPGCHSLRAHTCCCKTNGLAA